MVALYSFKWTGSFNSSDSISITTIIMITSSLNANMTDRSLH